MKKLKLWLAGHLHHLGWGCFGQECDCGFNRFNWLARIMIRIHGDKLFELTPEYDEHPPLHDRIGGFFIDVSRWLDPEAESM